MNQQKIKYSWDIKKGLTQTPKPPITKVNKPKEKDLKEISYKDIFSPETMSSLKGKSGEELRNMLGNKNLMQTMLRSQELLDQISKAEAPYRDLLENEAIDIVKKAYPIIDYASIEIDAKIIQEGQAQVSQHQPEEESEEVSPEEAPSDMKRKVINGITQGASVRGAFAFLLFRESLDDLDENLVEKYKEILKLTFGIYHNEQAVAMMLAMLAQGKKIAGGSEEVKYNKEEDKFTIYARAINFPFLVHEIIKGLYEILSLQGFSTDTEKNKKIVKQVDKVEGEPEDLKIGPIVFDTINNIYIDSGFDDPRVRDFLFTEIYKLDDQDFLSLIENALNNKLTSSQKSWMIGTMKQIDKDLKKDDLSFEI